MANVLTQIYDHEKSWSSLTHKPRKSLTIGKEMLIECQDEITMFILFGYPQPLLEKILSGISDYEMRFCKKCDNIDYHFRS